MKMNPEKEKLNKCQNLIEKQKKRRHKRRFQRNLHIFLFLLLCGAGVMTVRPDIAEGLLPKKVFPVIKKEKPKKPSSKKASTPQPRPEAPAQKPDPIMQARKAATDAGAPEYVLDLLDKNPETLAFVRDYPEKKNAPYFDKPVPLPKDGSYPHYLQFDERWGYMPYAGGVMANAGCGPTTCAMMATRLLNDPALTPAYMAKYAEDHGFMSANNGTYGGFMKEGMRSLGLKVTEGKTGREVTMKNLSEGHPIICLMRPGIFTDTGHYILLTGIKDGKIQLNDPFSTARTEKLWTYEELEPEVYLMWCYSR